MDLRVKKPIKYISFDIELYFCPLLRPLHSLCFICSLFHLFFIVVLKCSLFVYSVHGQNFIRVKLALIFLLRLISSELRARFQLISKKFYYLNDFLLVFIPITWHNPAYWILALTILLSPTQISFFMFVFQ